MEVELLEESCDPLHMPCVLKVEAVECDETVFQYELHTSIHIKSEIEEIKIEDETTSDTEMQLDVESVQTADINIDPRCREENMSECLSDANNYDNTPLEVTSYIDRELPATTSSNETNKVSSVVEKATNITSSVASKKLDIKIRVKCQICDLEMNLSSLERHIKNKHKTLKALCVNISDKSTSVETSCNNKSSVIENTTSTIDSMKNIKENSKKMSNDKKNDADLSTPLQEATCSNAETENILSDSDDDNYDNTPLEETSYSDTELTKTTPSNEKNKASSVVEKATNKTRSIANNKLGRKTKVKCQICDLEMNFSSLERHIKNKHKTSKASSVNLSDKPTEKSCNNESSVIENNTSTIDSIKNVKENISLENSKNNSNDKNDTNLSTPLQEPTWSNTETENILSDSDDDNYDNTPLEDASCSDTELTATTSSNEKNKVSSIVEKSTNITSPVANNKLGRKSKVKCHICNLEMIFSSLDRHIKNKHKTSKPSSVNLSDKPTEKSCNNKSSVIENTSNTTVSIKNINSVKIALENSTNNSNENKNHVSTPLAATCSNTKTENTWSDVSINELDKTFLEKQSVIKTPSKCSKCDQMFDSSFNLKYHIKHECHKIKFSCILCQESFKCKNELNGHVTEIHSNLNISHSEFDQLFIQKLNVNIAVNNKLALNVTKVQEQMEISGDDSPLPNSQNTSQVLPPTTIRSKKTLQYRKTPSPKLSARSTPAQRNNNSVTKVKKRITSQCFICGKTMNVKSIARHLYLHNRTMNCDNCHFKTQEKEALIQHMKKSHLKLPTKCKACHFKADSNVELQKHIFYAHDGKIILCKYCNFKTKYQYRLKIHLKSRHYFKRKRSSENKKTNKIGGNFKCEICYKLFMHFKNLKMHIKSHLKLQIETKIKLERNDNNVKIEKTNVVSENCEIKQEVSKTDSKYSQFTCKYCNKYYKTWSILKAHERYYCTSKSNDTRVFLYCDICNYKCKIKFHLAEHMKHKHQFVNKLYICKICGKKCTKKRSLDVHLQVHAGKNRKCNICDSEINERNYSNHMKKVHGQKFSCPDCSEMFDSKLELHRHKMFNHKSPPKPKDPNARPYKCKLCSKTYKTATHLKTHKQNIHIIRPPVVCEECGRLFKNNHTLKYHILKQHAMSSELYECQFCDKKFQNRGLKIAHEISSHKKNKKIIDPQYKDIFKPKKLKKVAKIDPNLIPQLTCQICGKIATSKCNLRAHIYGKHSDVKPFKCADCEKAFKYKRDLKNHSMVHTKEKPFKCPTCDFATKGIQTLRCHIASKHV